MIQYSLISEIPNIMTESVFKALADPTRRQILKLLKERPMTAGEIGEHFNLAKSTLSGHFNVLKAADLIIDERHQTSITYSLNLTVVDETLAVLMDLLKVNHRSNPTKEQK